MKKDKEVYNKVCEYLSPHLNKDMEVLELACGSRVIIVTTANSNYVYWVSSPILEKQNIRMIENLSEIEGI